jgi:hypothetical protein
VEPAAIEAAILAAQQAADEQDAVLQALHRDLEAARYAARRAFKQYDASDPDNRLVASELERRWNQALKRVQELELRIEQHTSQLHQLPAPTQGEFEDLAKDLQGLWNSPDTDVRLKKRIVRTLIREVVADIDAEASEVVLMIHWQGGLHTELRVPRRRRGQSNQHTSKGIIDAVRFLARICPDLVIAGVLNRNELLTGRGNRWTRERVTALRSHHKIPCHSQDTQCKEGWVNLTEAARLLGVAPRTLRLAVERGEIDAEHPLPDGPWIFNRQALDTATAIQLGERARHRSRTPAVPASKQKGLEFSSK